MKTTTALLLLCSATLGQEVQVEVQDNVVKIRIELDIKIAPRGSEPVDPPPEPPTRKWSISPHRDSGVAPLAVLFRAVDSSRGESDGFERGVTYLWDFGDGKTAAGPVAAHVFRTIGDHDVQLTVTNPDGTEETVQHVVATEDPESVFVGAGTVCFSTSGDFDGAPAGAELVTTSEASLISRHATAGKRILLRGGELFTTDRPVVVNSPGPGLIGSFGDGSAVVRSLTSTPVFQLSSKKPSLSDWRIVGLAIQGGSQGFRAEGTVENLLVLGCVIVMADVGFMIDKSVPDFYNANGFPGHTIHDGVFLVDNQVMTKKYCGFLAAQNLALLGNNLETTVSLGDRAHVVRITHGRDVVMIGNRLANPGRISHALKFHASDFSDASSVAQGFSERVFIRNNVFEGGPESDWTVVIGPQNAQSDERVRDVILEQNRFIAGNRTRVALMLNASRVTVEKNEFTPNNQSFYNCAEVRQRGVEPAPTDVQILENVNCGDQTTP